MTYRIRDASTADLPAIRQLLPRLAAFDVPARRSPEDLWRGDEQMLLRWADGDEPDLVAQVAVDGDSILGVVVIRLRAESFSGAPSAHLETVTVAKEAEGRGIGKALVAAAENVAQARGAQSMTLHVFGVNTRARALYEKLGYDGELIRYIKELSDPS